MKKAQTIVMYGILILLLGTIIFSSMFLLSTSIERASSEELTILISDMILSTIESKILDMQIIAEYSETSVEHLIELPKHIGSQEYSVVGYGNKITIRVSSRVPLNRERKIGSNIQCSGVSFPPNLYLIYNKSTNSVTIK